jgi:bacterioferritin-associated ferredoxin
MAPACTAERCDSCAAKVVCRCLQVTDEQLVRMITALDLRTVRELRKQTGVGDGCTCCHRDLEQYLERFSLAVVD